MTEDGIALNSVTHPKAPWWKRPYLWLRSLRGIRESSLVTAVLDSENLPGAWGIRNTIRRWERDRLVSGLHDEIEAAAKQWVPAGWGAVLSEPERPVVSLKPMNLSGGRVDYYVSIRVGGREVTPHVFRAKYKADYHVALYDWLLNGTGEEPDVMDFGPSDEYPEFPDNAMPGLGSHDARRSAKVCGYHDGCPADAPACHLCSGLQPNADRRAADEPWHPMTDPAALKHLGKLIEECGELVSAAARSVIQGIDESEPVTGKPNRTWLQEELTDVAVGVDLCVEHFNIDENAISERYLRKIKRLRQWHKGA